MQDKIFSLIFDEEELNWQTLLLDLVKSEGMNPWDIDISQIAKKYIETVRKLKETNLRISGKVILASAILLAFKSKRLIKDDLQDLDRMFAAMHQQEYDDYDDVDLLGGYGNQMVEERKGIFPRTPQPRTRKISVYDLIESLEKAMEVRRRRVVRRMPDAKRKIMIPDTIDVTEMIIKVYKEIKEYFAVDREEKLTFKKLQPSEEKESKVFTFVPLLHLENERRINLHQKEHFGEISIEMLRGTK